MQIIFCESLQKVESQKLLRWGKCKQSEGRPQPFLSACIPDPAMPFSANFFSLAHLQRSIFLLRLQIPGLTPKRIGSSGRRVEVIAMIQRKFFAICLAGTLVLCIGCSEAVSEAIGLYQTKTAVANAAQIRRALVFLRAGNTNEAVNVLEIMLDSEIQTLASAAEFGDLRNARDIKLTKSILEYRKQYSDTNNPNFWLHEKAIKTLEEKLPK